MFVDASKLAPPAPLRADVCVVGAGPAGIVLALELAKSGLHVLLIESGGAKFDSGAQNLGEARILDAARHAPMSLATRRQLGGTSVLWGGRCVPLDEVDFQPRQHVPDAQWPIEFAEMAAHYPQACEYAGCGPADFNSISAIPGGQPTIVPGLSDGPVISSQLERWSSPANFGKRYHAALAAHPRITCLLNATCTSIECQGNSEAVDSLSLATLGGKRLSAAARWYALAAGGIATTRLLLASNRVHPEGMGNLGGKLGRFYMGHLSGKIADIRFTSDPGRTLYEFERDARGTYCRKRFTISAAQQHAHRLLNCALWLDNPRLPDPDHRNGILSLAFLALRTPLLGRRLAPEAIVAAAVGGAGHAPVLPHYLNILRDLPSVAAFAPMFAYRRYVSNRRVPGFFVHSRRNVYALHFHAEQKPSEDSRIYLGDETDALGIRRPIADLKFCAADADSVVRTHHLLDAHLRAQGCGRLDYRFADLQAAVSSQARDGFHQIGSTRMSVDPRHGVVDANCKVHGIHNLYVSSSSVFPTSGQANPTLSVLALSIRLARHLGDLAR
ncbi:MAG: FAD-dependent oxidoreductase [Burkholderiales bacterium]